MGARGSASLTLGIIPAPRAGSELVSNGCATDRAFVLLESTGSARGVEIERLGPAVVTEPPHLLLVVGQGKLL